MLDKELFENQLYFNNLQNLPASAYFRWLKNIYNIIWPHKSINIFVPKYCLKIFALVSIFKMALSAAGPVFAAERNNFFTTRWNFHFFMWFYLILNNFHFPSNGMRIEGFSVLSKKAPFIVFLCLEIAFTFIKNFHFYKKERKNSFTFLKRGCQMEWGILNAI